MKNGDISNEVPPRFIVLLDTVSTEEEVTTTKWKVKKKTDVLLKWDMRALAFLWNFSSRVGVTFELAGFDVSQEYMEQTMDNLTNRGTNPFNYVVAYRDINELLDELPFRQDVIGVIANPNTVARFGSWGVEMEYLYGR